MMRTNPLSQAHKTPRSGGQLFTFAADIVECLSFCGLSERAKCGSAAAPSNENARSDKNIAEPVDNGDLSFVIKPRKKNSSRFSCAYRWQ